MRFIVPQRLPLFLALLCWSLFLTAMTDGCDENKKEEETSNTPCILRGECKITYRYDANGRQIEAKRTCKKDTDNICAACWDKKFDDKKQLLAQTCAVCNLCTTDFECTTDSDCKGSSPFCQAGSCLPCRHNGDCEGETKSFCCNNPSAQNCSVVGCVACLNDSDCKEASLPQCRDGQCSPCRCPQPQQHCWKSPVSFQVLCVDCLEDSHCQAPTPRCDLTQHVCISACSTDQDCPSDRFCSQGTCLECRSSKDCNDLRKPTCIKGVCGCEAHGDCPSDFSFCEKEICVECRTAKDCPRGFPRCLAGECALRLCTDPSQCTTAEYDRCRQLGTHKVCLGCTEDKDCPAGQECDLSTLTCRTP